MSESSGRRLGFSIIVAAATIILIWGIRGLAGLLNPILLAIVITITLLPVPLALEKRGAKTGPALLLTIAVVVLSVIGFSWLMLTSISHATAEVPSLTASFGQRNASVSEASNPVEQLVQSAMNTLNRQQYSQTLTALLGIFANIISQFFLTVLIFVFMLYTALSLPNLSRLGIDASSNAVNEIIALTSDVRRYMTLTAGINLLVGIGDALLLWFLGVPYAILWGLIAWVLGFIPAVGYWIALIPPVLLAYSLFGTQTALIVFIGYALINGTAANVIAPRVLGKGLSISPLIVFVSVFIWGWLLGAIGAILAIPLTMLIITVLKSFSTTEWVARLMSYVPGSEQEADVEAVGRAKQIFSKIRRRLPAGDGAEADQVSEGDS